MVTDFNDEIIVDNAEKENCFLKGQSKKIPQKPRMKVTDIILPEEMMSSKAIIEEDFPEPMRHDLPSPIIKRMDEIKIQSPNQIITGPSSSSPNRRPSKIAAGIKRAYQESPLSKADQDDAATASTLTLTSTPTSKLPRKRKQDNKIFE